MFDRCTKKKAHNGRDWRLLIVDGHGSHVNIPLIEFCHERRIIMAILPPHSTHRLQLLDVSLFSPLSTAYSQEVDFYITATQGLTGISKRDFWRFFWPSFKKAFTKENIESGWKKTGLYPFNPSIVLDRLPKKRTQRVPLPPYNVDSILPLAPTDTTAIRKLLDVQTSRASREGKQLRATVWDMAVTNILQQREIVGLKDAHC